MSPAVITTDDETTNPRITGRELRRLMLVRTRIEIVGAVLLCLLVSSVMIGQILIMRRLIVVTSICCPAASLRYDSQPQLKHVD